jgi:hypothetical protein
MGWWGSLIVAAFDPASSYCSEAAEQIRAYQAIWVIRPPACAQVRTRFSAILQLMSGAGAFRAGQHRVPSHRQFRILL